MDLISFISMDPCVFGDTWDGEVRGPDTPSSNGIVDNSGSSKGSPILPDLTDPGSGTGPDWGQSLTVDTGIHNGSNAIVETPFIVSYYLSEDQIPDADEKLLDVEIIHSLMPFEHYFETVNLPLPASDPSGTGQREWFILTETDSGNAIGALQFWGIRSQH